MLFLNAISEHGIGENPARLEEVFCQIVNYQTEIAPGQSFTSSMLEKRSGGKRYDYADLLESLEELEIIRFGRGRVGESCRDDAIKINASSSLITATDACIAEAEQICI